MSGPKELASQLLSAVRRTIRGAAVIESGPAKDLRFDAGADTPRFTPGRYEPPIQECIANVVKPGEVCYDIGANLGFFTILLARLAGSAGIVYAFEPVPRNAEIVEGNARLNDMTNISVLRYAVADRNGTSELLLAEHAGGAVLKSAGTPPDLVGSTMVETRTLDTLVEQNGLRPPTFVKIDVEGAELDVLQGMQSVLERHGPTILLEVDDAEEAECERKFAACASFLEVRGYRIERLPLAYPDNRWFVKHFLARR